MTHPLDEAIAEARRMLSNARLVGGIIGVPRDFTGKPFLSEADLARRKEEQAQIVEKWTRIEQALVETKAKTSCRHCGGDVVVYCSGACDSDE